MMLSKLHLYGFRRKAYDLFNSYLTDKKQKVENGNNRSEIITIEYGVSQGTV